MAKLRERDLQRILGDDWRLLTGSAGPGYGRIQAELNEKRRKDRLNDSLFTAGGGLAIGIGLVASAVMTMKDLAMWGWLAFAIALIVGSTVWMISLRRRLSSARDQASVPASPSSEQALGVPESSHSMPSV